ncbi:MAG: DUF6883 domain-containing protein [Cyanobacteria bacterium J06635_1]
MQISENAIIPEAKLTQYLLVYRARNDKSKFLAQAGFTQTNPGILKVAIQTLIATNEAFEERTNEYGTFYQAVGMLEGPNGIQLSVVTIWLRRKIDDQFQFITLTPYREAKS